MRQPYGRDIASTVVYAHPVWFARHGYNVVIQDVRGRGDSEGDFYPFRNEGRDGAETIAWLRTRPEVERPYRHVRFLLSGHDATAGCRRATRRPALHRAGDDGLRSLSRLVLSPWRAPACVQAGLGIADAEGGRAAQAIARSQRRLEAAWANLGAQTSVLPFRDHPALHAEGVPQYVLDWFDHDPSRPARRLLDIARRQPIVRTHHCARAACLRLVRHLSEGSIDGFLALVKRAGTTFAREHQYLIAGPWQHIPWGDRVGTANFGAEALLDTDAILLRWFNHWLKDSGEFSGEPRIRHFVLGENSWRQSSS